MGLWRGIRTRGKAFGSNIQNAKWVPKQSTGYRLPEAINVNYRYRGPEREELFHFPKISEHIIHFLSLQRLGQMLKSYFPFIMKISRHSLVV